MRAVILILAVSAAVSAQPVGAQVALSSADSLSVLLQTLDAAASDTVYRSTPMFTEDRVLWWAAEGDLLPSGQILDQLRQSYPNLRVADDLRDVYLCDDGGLPRYPLDPCRVKDGGVILRFGRIATPPDEFDVSVTFSYANSRGISGWRSGFMRVEGGLKLSHFRQIWIS